MSCKTLDKPCPDLLNPSDLTEWWYAKCIRCYSLFLINPPSKETISIAYQNYYTHSSPDNLNAGSNSIPKQSLSIAKIFRYVAISYKQSKGLSVAGGNLLLAKLFQILPVDFPLLDRQLRSLNELPKTDQTMVLDVGCGNGSFLLLAQKFGFISHGVDFDIESVKTASNHQIQVFHGDISTIKESFGEEKYDLITFCNSLEHLYNPLESLTKAYSLLKPGGIVWIETPSSQALGFFLLRHLWRGLEAPRHLQIFSATSLIRQLRQIGFKEVVRRRQVSHHAFIRYSYAIALKTGLRPSISLKIKYYISLLLSPIVAIFRLDCSEYIQITAKK